ncbi:hypothetical protein GIB67_025936 [Kingdonia uniflora]|uniref:Uncharacterized protein n=1 Tax=Kingdonia uniflora TaxID=39325 RepID=A0A7J7P015_9MAGN|nr:hypothetical protein GIB67_025936 [Kingdonia uniflora]
MDETEEVQDMFAWAIENLSNILEWAMVELLLNETGMKRGLHPQQEAENEPKKDLRSRGLCLVPVSTSKL